MAGSLWNSYSSSLPGGVCYAGDEDAKGRVQLLGITGIHSQASRTGEPVPRQACHGIEVTTYLCSSVNRPPTSS